MVRRFQERPARKSHPVSVSEVHASKRPTHAASGPAAHHRACPSYRAIADRYAGKPNAYEMLVRKVKSGGWGHWGDIAMPPKTARAELSDQEAATLVKWVLQQK